MDKKNIGILISGIIMYSIGFFYLNLIGEISMMIGGIILSILFVRIGIKIKNRRKIMGKIFCVLGTVLAFLITIISIIVIILTQIKFR